MAGPQEIQNSLLAAGFARVARLCEAGRHHEALADAVALYERFPHAPAACTGLVDTLLAMGRAEMAHTVLRRACQRFPSETWLSLRLAELASELSDWPEAVVRWRAAGLPEQGSVSQLVRFAKALAANGDTQEALRVASMPGSDSPVLRLTHATLLARVGRHGEAAALWPELANDFTLADQEFANLTAALALNVAPAQANPMLAMLLAEPDPGGEEWRPAIAAAMANVRQGDAAGAVVLAALPAAPSGTARAVAARLAGEIVGPDQLALQISACVAAGRIGLLPLLLETPGTAVRTAQLRVALRLYLNRSFADPKHFEALSAASVCVLLQIARVADQACFNFVAELTRGPFKMPANLDFTRPEDVAASAARALPLETAVAEPAVTASSLRVAVCVSGRLSATQGSADPIRALGLQSHDATVFAHLWHGTGRSAGVPGLEILLPRLPPKLRAAFAAAADLGGLAGLRLLYPTLLQGRVQRAVIDVEAAKLALCSEHVVVQNDQAAEFAGQDAAWKASYSRWQAHELMRASGRPFDIVVHMAGDAELGVSANWPSLARDLLASGHNAGGLLFADANYQFDRVSGFSVAPLLAIGAPEVMDLAAAGFQLGCDLTARHRSIYGVRPSEAMAQAMAWQLHLHGIAIELLDGLLIDAAAHMEPLTASQALALLWHDIRARRPASPDTQLVNAAMADLTGGIGP